MFKRLAYCTSCKQNRYVLKQEFETVKTPAGNARKVVKGKCVSCGARIYQFIKNGGTFSSLFKRVFDW